MTRDEYIRLLNISDSIASFISECRAAGFEGRRFDEALERIDEIVEEARN